MKQENSDNTLNLNELSQKMEKMDELLKKDFFSNPVKQIQEKLREELLDFSASFHTNLRDLETYVTELETNKTFAKIQNGPGACDEDEMVSIKLLEKKEYQVEILKNSFSDYEKKTGAELERLNSENTKLKYRIGVLLDSIEKLEQK